MNRADILKAAIKIHDESGCQCDRKYIMSCPKLAEAILNAKLPEK